MTFPFVTEFEEKTKLNYGPRAETKALYIIEQYVKSRRVDDFYRVGNSFKFKKGFFGLNTNVFSLIDKGEFIVKNDNEKLSVLYRFYSLRFFITSTIMVIGFSLLSRQLIFGLIAFFVLVICNFLISFVRQKGVINDIIYNINTATLD